MIMVNMFLKPQHWLIYDFATSPYLVGQTNLTTATSKTINNSMTMKEKKLNKWLMRLETNKATTSKAKQHHNSMVTAACNLKNNNIKEFEFSQAFPNTLNFCLVSDEVESHGDVLGISMLWNIFVMAVKTHTNYLCWFEKRVLKSCLVNYLLSHYYFFDKEIKSKTALYFTSLLKRTWQTWPILGNIYHLNFHWQLKSSF